MGARFNRDEITKRIRRISRYRSRIKLYQLDGLDFTRDVVARLAKTSFVFYDPPYIEHGSDLYFNEYSIRDHETLSRHVSRLGQPWVVTYDAAAMTHGLYPSHRRLAYDLTYSAQSRYQGREVMFISNRLRLPIEWMTSQPIRLSERRSRSPLFGLMSDGGAPSGH
jgi:DNA adenine methylase